MDELVSPLSYLFILFSYLQKLQKFLCISERILKTHCEL